MVGRAPAATGRRGKRGSRGGLRKAESPGRGARGDRGRAPGALSCLEDQFRAHAGPRARSRRGAAAPGIGNRAAPPPDRCSRRHADGTALTPRGASGRLERRIPRGRARRRRGRGRRDRRVRGRGSRVRRGSRRGAAVPLPPPDCFRQDDRRRGLRRGGAHDGRTHPDAPTAAREPVHRRPDDRGLRLPAVRSGAAGHGSASREPPHHPDVRLVRPARGVAFPDGLPARHLRRGAHCARREDERGDPQLHGADLHRHDGDGGADREAGLGRLPGLRRRSAAQRRCPARTDRSRFGAFAYPRRPPSRRSRSSAATTTRRRWPRCSTTS